MSKYEQNMNVKQTMCERDRKKQVILEKRGMAMTIRILCVGKIKEDFYRKRIEESAARIQRQCRFRITEVADEKTQEHMSQAQIEKVRRTEGERLLHYLPIEAGEWVVALCIDGEESLKHAWYQNMAKRIREREISQLTYIIGGSLGLDERVIRRADQTLSVSKLTFPHQLMRVMLTEHLAQHIRDII